MAERSAWQQALVDRMLELFESGEPVQVSLHTGRQGYWKNRIQVEVFEMEALLGNHVHLIGLGEVRCSKDPPCSFEEPLAGRHLVIYDDI